MTRLVVTLLKEVTMEAVEEIDIEDLWEYNLTELMEDCRYEEVDSEVLESSVEVVET